MTSWIFQGNPKEFQVDEYLKRKEIYWNLEQHKKGTSLDDSSFKDAKFSQSIDCIPVSLTKD